MQGKLSKSTAKKAVYSVFLSLSPLALAIGFGICMGYVGQSVMIIIPFAAIRKFSGGYHTKHAWTCLFWSCLLLSLCIALSFHIRCGWGLAIVTAGAAVSLICFSPIGSENRRLCMEELKRCKKATAALVLIFMLVDALFLACGLHIMPYAFPSGLYWPQGCDPLYLQESGETIWEMTK